MSVVAPPAEVRQVIDQELSQARVRLTSLQLAQQYENTPVPEAVKPKSTGPASVRDFLLQPGNQVPRGCQLAWAIEATEIAVEILEGRLADWQHQQDLFVADSRERLAAVEAALEGEGE